MILLDANVLVYAVNADAPQHSASRTVVRAAFDGQLPGVLVPQVLVEFLAVVANQRRVRYPLDPATAWEQMGILSNKGLASGRVRRSSSTMWRCGGELGDPWRTAAAVLTREAWVE